MTRVRRKSSIQFKHVELSILAPLSDSVHSDHIGEKIEYTMRAARPTDIISAIISRCSVIVPSSCAHKTPQWNSSTRTYNLPLEQTTKKDSEATQQLHLASVALTCTRRARHSYTCAERESDERERERGGGRRERTRSTSRARRVYTHIEAHSATRSLSRTSLLPRLASRSPNYAN